MKKIGEWLIATGVAMFGVIAITIIGWLCAVIITSFGPGILFGGIVFIFAVVMIHSEMFGQYERESVRRVNVPPKKKKVDLDS